MQQWRPLALPTAVFHAYFVGFSFRVSVKKGLDSALNETQKLKYHDIIQKLSRA
jgi:hypothetical protein